MEMLNLIRLIAGIFFISLGTIIFILEISGVFKFKYVLNRMHFAGTGDTMGLMSVIIGTIIINGWNFGSFKLALVLMLFWFASPVSSHLISRLVLETDENLKDQVKVCDKEESKKYFNGEEAK